MPLITGKLDKRRAIIDVGLQPAALFVEGVQPMQSAPAMHIRPLKGLFDTGAQLTCITRSVAVQVGLVPRGKRRVGGISNIETHNSYSFVLGVWYDEDGGDTLNSIRGYYGFEPVLGIDFKDNSDFDVLIGMDIIEQGDFSTTRDGYFRWQLP